MTDITVDLNTSEGYIVPAAETSSNWMAAFPSYGGLLAALGTPDERSQGYMIINSVADWYARLSSTYETGWFTQDIEYTTDGQEIIVYTNETPNGTDDANWPNGPEDPWKDEWWAVHNYLRYGGSCVISGTVDNKEGTANHAISVIVNLPRTVNCVFTNNYSYNQIIINIANSRSDCIAVCPVIITGPSSNSNNIKGLPDNQTTSKITFHMAGQKLHLGTSQSYTIGDSTSDALITTPLASDAAGCMARVRASSSPYASPAGIDQGRILDVVRMEYIPTKTDISLLNASNVNTIRVFQGSGTSLFSDMTGRLNSDSDPEIFKYVNVTLTYLHLNTTISEIIRPYLFKNNNTSTRSAVVNTIIPVLRNAVAAGGLTEYSVVCDETNNPETVVNSNGLVVDVSFRPTQSIQRVKINFTAKSGSQSVAAPGGGGGVGGVSTAASTTSTTTTSTSTPTTGGSSY